MRRLSVRLPDPAHERLEQRARESGVPVARAATDLLCGAVLGGDSVGIPTAPVRAAHAGGSRPSRNACTPGDPAASPPWLPSDADPSWAENTWGAIVALCRRYPDALAKLEHDWHERPERVEVLAALATWRATIDAIAEDPREELSFHNALRQMARTLDLTLGHVRPFDPNAHFGSTLA